MFQRLLIPLDGSPGAECAIPVAASLAHKSGGSLIFLHILAPAVALKSMIERLPEASHQGTSFNDDEKYTEAIEQKMADAASYLTTISTRYEKELAGLPIEMDIAFGTTAPMLLSTARLEHIDLVVLCRHREAGPGQWGLESVAQQMMRHSPAPLLILNEHEKMPVLDGTLPLRILVPLDGSLFAETVLVPALELLSQCAGSGPGELCLMHVVNLFAADRVGEENTRVNTLTASSMRQKALHYLQAVAAHLREKPECGPNIHITCLVTSGMDIASSILRLRNLETMEGQTAPSLIALATHGREGMRLQAMGSVAEQLLSATTTSLLTVCPGAKTDGQIHSALPAEKCN